MAWTDLEPILLRTGIDQDGPHVRDCLYAVSTASTRGDRRRALDAAAAALAETRKTAPVLSALSGEGSGESRCLALELAARTPELADAEAVRGLRRLLRDRWIPYHIRLSAAASLARAGSSGAAVKVFRNFVAGFGKARFLKHRQRLRRRFAGRKKVFDRYAARLARQVRLGCPRCGVKLSRALLAEHLWERHSRLLVGRRVRSPWRLIERWVAAAGAANGHRQLLGLVRHDDEAVAALRREAVKQRAGLCPHCFATVPLSQATFPSETDISPLTLSRSRLAGHGFAVELARSLAGQRLRITSSKGVIFDGPASNPTRIIRSRRWLALPVVALAIILAVTLPPMEAILATAVALVVAAGLAIFFRAAEVVELADRLVDHAWRELVPYLCQQINRGHPSADGEPVPSAESNFLAALAVTSQRHGHAAVRENWLRRSIGIVRAAMERRLALPLHLVELHKLQAEDSNLVASDPVNPLADAIRPCFTGELTPAAAEMLLAHDVTYGWTPGQRGRLRVLLAARAFAAGFGVWDLQEFGQVMPRLGEMLDVQDTDGLARLRFLWDLRPSRPWKHCGPAATVFELAAYPTLGGQHLETAPDLLLFQPLPAGGEPVHLLACGRGLIIGGELLHSWPTAFESRPLPGSKGGGYDLRFGPHAIQVHGNVDDLIRRLAAWGQYFFEEFQPWIGNALTRPNDRSPNPLDRLMVKCPSCGSPFIGRRGNIGQAIFPKSSRPVISDRT